MKKSLSFFSILFIYFFGVGQTPDWNQFGNQLGETVAAFQAASLSNQLYRAARAQANLTATENAIKYLKEGNAAECIAQSEAAIIEVPFYSTPYFIAAMGYLKQKDYLNAKRYIDLYHWVNHRYRREGNPIVLPIETVDATIAFIEKNYNLLSPDSIRKQIKQEAWRNNMVRINLHPSGYLMPGSDDIFHARVNLGLQYEKNFWWNKKKRLAFQNFTNGFTVKTTLQQSLNLANSYRYTPEILRLNIRPAFYLGKMYISPGEYRVFSKMDVPVNYTDRFVPGTHEIYNHSAFVVSPELRLYPGPINHRALHRRKLNKPRPQLADSREEYFLLFYDRDRLSGYTASRGIWSNKRDEIFFGMGSQTFRIMMSLGQIHEFQQLADGYETDRRYLYFACHYHFSIGLF